MYVCMYLYYNTYIQQVICSSYVLSYIYFHKIEPRIFHTYHVSSLLLEP